MKPKESARCHQTLSSRVGSGDETKGIHAHTVMYKHNSPSFTVLPNKGMTPIGFMSYNRQKKCYCVLLHKLLKPQTTCNTGE